MNTRTLEKQETRNVLRRLYFWSDIPVFRILNVQARKANKDEGLKGRGFQNHLSCPFFMKREERKNRHSPRNKNACKRNVYRHLWRRWWDSNPRIGCPINAFRAFKPRVFCRQIMRFSAKLRYLEANKISLWRILSLCCQHLLFLSGSSLR